MRHPLIAIIALLIALLAGGVTLAFATPSPGPADTTAQKPAARLPDAAQLAAAPTIAPPAGGRKALPAHRVEGLNGASVPFSALKDPATGHNDVYAMMIAGFSVWYVSLFYLAGVGLLCFHLSHGVSAMFQSLGLMNRAYRSAIDTLARGAAVALFCGYLSIPTAVLVFGHGRDHLQKVAQHQKTGTTAVEEQK